MQTIYIIVLLIVLACADAYLTPVIQRYVCSFKSGFTSNLKVML